MATPKGIYSLGWHHAPLEHDCMTSLVYMRVVKAFVRRRGSKKRGREQYNTYISAGQHSTSLTLVTARAKDFLSALVGERFRRVFFVLGIVRMLLQPSFF